MRENLPTFTVDKRYLNIVKDKPKCMWVFPKPDRCVRPNVDCGMPEKISVRDWSIITGRGRGYKMGAGGGAEKVLAMLKGGGHEKFWGIFYALA